MAGAHSSVAVLGVLVASAPDVPGSAAQLLHVWVAGRPGIDGLGVITGTVKVRGTPNAPVHRKVRCFRESDGLCVAEVWSNATTGEYSVTALDLAQRYTILAYDHLGVWKAVASDGKTPMPWLP